MSVATLIKSFVCNLGILKHKLPRLIALAIGDTVCRKSKYHPIQKDRNSSQAASLDSPHACSIGKKTRDAI
ncbi:hypothetical protein [Cohaesibacter marisflavi]|uniref:hypothetical protein n=1 Tax=Cohaesibacter marisflavi TaxID=655353 RepID=UPI001113E9A3|nr:hypothetical protein [Cohaesibacter marisflavi]